jgi:hypothetical protein
MKLTTCLALSVISCAPFAGYAAEVGNLNGSWVLKPERSRWGNVKSKPTSAMVTIQHQEPVYKYTGSSETNGEHEQEYRFDGAIDGKPYPASFNGVPGKMTVTRLDDKSIQSEFRSDDGKTTVVTRTSVSADGTTMTRSITSETPEGNFKWVEVYEKKA